VIPGLPGGLGQGNSLVPAVLDELRDGGVHIIWNAQALVLEPHCAHHLQPPGTGTQAYGTTSTQGHRQTGQHAQQLERPWFPNAQALLLEPHSRNQKHHNPQ